MKLLRRRDSRVKGGVSRNKKNQRKAGGRESIGEYKSKCDLDGEERHDRLQRAETHLNAPHRKANHVLKRGEVGIVSAWSSRRTIVGGFTRGASGVQQVSSDSNHSTRRPFFPHVYVC